MDVPGGTFGFDNFGGFGFLIGGDEIGEEEDDEDEDVFGDDCGSSFFGGGFLFSEYFPSSLIRLIGMAAP